MNKHQPYPIHIMRSARPLLIPLLCLASIAAAFRSEAAVVISESFASPVGGIPQNWTEVIRNSGANNGAVGIESVPGVTENALKFFRAANGSSGNFGANANAAVYYTNPTDAQIGDFSAEVTLRLDAALGVSSSVGIMLRTQSLAYQFNSTPFAGYYVALNSEGLGIYENPTNNSAPGALLSPLSAFVATGATDYLFRVSAEGNALNASIWDASGSLELASVSYSMATIAEGYFGFRSGFGNYATTAYFRDLTLTVVPEPTSLLFVAIGAGVALHLSRRRATKN